MRGFISSSFLLGMLLLVQAGSAQNVTIELTPIIYPIVLPDSGGSFDYLLTMTNQGGTPITATVWCMATLPNGTSWGPALGPATQTLGAGQTQSYYRTQTVPPRALYGYFILHAYVGIYPNTVWAEDEFEFQRQGISGTEQQWVARYNGPGNSVDKSTSLAVDGAGNVYVTGYSISGIMFEDYTTIKYNASGNQVWVARYNGSDGEDYAYSITVDNSGNVYVTGASDSYGTFQDYATIKYNSLGNQIWVAHYNGPGNDADEAKVVAIDGSGNVYVTGASWGNATNWDYATIKYDADGNQLWAARYNGTGNGGDVPHALSVDGEGNVYVTGMSIESGTGADYTTIKYDSNGNQVWVARYNGTGNNYDYAYSLAVDGDGNVFITGKSLSSGGNDDYVTIKYDSSGNQIWVTRYIGPANSNDEARSIAVDGSGNVYVTGKSNSGITFEDYATLKYDSAGNQIWVARYNGSGYGGDEANSLALDGDDNVYVTGWSDGIGTSADYLTIKYSGGNLDNWMPLEATALGQPLPQENRLESNYPNPFNATTAISYQLSAFSEQLRQPKNL